jgi:hypothetical protein
MRNLVLRIEMPPVATAAEFEESFARAVNVTCQQWIYWPVPSRQFYLDPGAMPVLHLSATTLDDLKLVGTVKAVSQGTKEELICDIQGDVTKRGVAKYRADDYPRRQTWEVVDGLDVWVMSRG